MRFITIMLLVASTTASAQDPWKNIYSKPAWEARDKWQRADELISLMKIPEGSHVADIGCHEGYMTFKLARVVNDAGKVYAVDVDQSKLTKLDRYITEKKLTNIQTIKGDYDDPKLPQEQLDAVIILDTYHEMDDHDEILQHVKTALKKGGRLVICEPIADERRKLSRSAQEGKHELGMSYALEDLTKGGFRIIHQKDPFVDRTKEKGDKMWVIVVEKP
jgi:ubiquinone/menaquinone biosynthesis C-methylase UbiE